DLRDSVHTLRHHPRRAERECAAETGVRAGVADYATAQSGDRAVARASELHVLDLSPPVRHRDEVLRPRLDPLHRALQTARGGNDHHVLGREPGLTAEGATYIGRDDSHAFAR